MKNGHADHLNTPRAITDEQQRVVWRWENSEPFGKSLPEDDPDGDGVQFEFPLRFPGQYRDRETGLFYNYFRDYDPQTGRYIQSDPIGLDGGINPYLYVRGSPLAYVDPDGLEVRLICRPVVGTAGRYSHCFVYVTCPAEGIDEVLSLFGKFPYGVIPGLPSTGYKSSATPSEGAPLRDDPNAPANTYNQVITPRQTNCDCGYEKSVISRFFSAPATQQYGGTSSNSNTFAQDLITSPQFGGSWPANAPSNAVGTVPMSAGRIR